MASLLLGTTIGGFTAIHSNNISSQSVNYATSAGNASTVSSITGNTGLMINRLTPTSFIDGLTTSTFRSSLFNTTSNGAAISAARWNSVPAPLSGMNMYGTMIAWSGDSDTHGFVATDYAAPIIKVGGGYGNIIAWTATLVHSENIGSQSVNYATTAGSVSGGLTTSNYASTLDGRYFFDFGFTIGYPGTDANNMPGNRSAFTYSNGAPYTGPIAHFGAAGYGLQLNANYGTGTLLGFRVRNGDNGTWNAWREIIHSGNIASQSVSYADESGYSASTGTTDNIGGVQFRNTGSNAGTNADTIDSNGITYYTAGVANFSGNATDGALYSQRYSTSWQHQIAGDYRSGQIALRGRNNGTWQSWRTVLDSGNYSSYVVPKTGGSFTGGIGGTTFDFGGGGYVGGATTFASSISATILYDSNDQSYYVDPNGLSRIYRLSIVGDWAGANPNEGAINIRGNYPSMTFRNTISGNMWLRHMDGAGDIQHYFAPSGVDANDWSIKHSMRTDGTFQSNGSMRSPIFYDSQDTGYYLDPNGSSNLLTVTINNNYVGNAIYFGGANNYLNWTFGRIYSNVGIESAQSLRSPQLRVTNSTNNAYITGNSDWGLQIVNDNGFIQFGPANNSWAHIYSNLNFYMNNHLWVSGGFKVTAWDYNNGGGALYASAFIDANDTTYYLDPNGGGYLRGRVDVVGGHNNSSFRVALRPDENGIGTGVVTLQSWCSEPGNTWEGAGFGYNVDNNSNANAPSYHFGRPNPNFGQAFMRMFPDGAWRFYNATTGAAFSHTMTLSSDGHVTAEKSLTSPSVTSLSVLVNNHSDNTRGYRIHNTSGSSVSAMFTNSANALVIGAGAFDQVQLNKKTFINGAALGVNVSASATAGRIDASNDIVAYSSSDERLKYNITPIENALDKVKSITGVEFDWKPEYKHAHGYEGHDTGIIAQQVQDVMPSAVRTNETGFLAVRYEKLIGLLIEANKELAARVEELEKKLG